MIKNFSKVKWWVVLLYPVLALVIKFLILAEDSRQDI